MKLSYGLLFYLQRTLMSLILAFSTKYSIQSALFQITLLLNFALLLHIRPYKDPRDSWQEVLNCALVLISVVLLLPLSSWTQSFETRYYLGLYFDTVIAIGFFVNFGAVMIQALVRMPMVFRRMIFRIRIHRQR